MDNSTRINEIRAHQEIEELYRAYRQELLIYIKNYVLQSGPLRSLDAEDILQETFLRTFRHLLVKGGGINQPKPYLRAVARNCYNEYIRDQSAVSLTSLSSTVDRLHVEEAEFCVDPEEVSLVQEQITEPLETLSPTQKELIDLIHQGYTQKEAAQKLGKRPSSARAALSRSRKKMREVTSNE